MHKNRLQHIPQSSLLLSGSQMPSEKKNGIQLLAIASVTSSSFAQAASGSMHAYPKSPQS